MILKKKWFIRYLIQSALLLLALLLGVLGNYVWVVFRSDTREMIVKKFSFLSVIPFGYGLFFPMLFILLTIILVIFSLSRLFIATPKNKCKIQTILGVADVICLVLPVLIGMQIFNIGIAVMGILIIGSLLINFFS